MHSPRRRRRSEVRSDALIAGVVFAFVCLAAVAGLWMLGRSSAVGPFACAGYEFARGEWRRSTGEERREQARLIARCDRLVGRTRRQIRADLGDPDREPDTNREWWFFVGRPNDFLRLSDAGHLVVRFNRSGRVVRAEAPDSGN